MAAQRTVSKKGVVLQPDELNEIWNEGCPQSQQALAVFFDRLSALDVGEEANYDRGFFQRLPSLAFTFSAASACDFLPVRRRPSSALAPRVEARSTSKIDIGELMLARPNSQEPPLFSREASLRIEPARKSDNPEACLKEAATCLKEAPCLKVEEAVEDPTAKEAKEVEDVCSNEQPELVRWSSYVKMPNEALSAVSKQINKAMQLVHEAEKTSLNKQNCHFCGRNRKTSDRILCNNPWCSLQGKRRKYLCRQCVTQQKKYFVSRGIDPANIVGDVESHEWYCPACILWEDKFLPAPGLCCCSFRRCNLFCPLHEDNTKRNRHCKPYRQRNTRMDKMLSLKELDLRRMRIGSKPYMRKVLSEADYLKEEKKEKKEKREEEKEEFDEPTQDFSVVMPKLSPEEDKLPASQAVPPLVNLSHPADYFAKMGELHHSAFERVLRTVSEVAAGEMLPEEAVEQGPSDLPAECTALEAPKESEKESEVLKCSAATEMIVTQPTKEETSEKVEEEKKMEEAVEETNEKVEETVEETKGDEEAIAVTSALSEKDSGSEEKKAVKKAVKPAPVKRGRKRRRSAPKSTRITKRRRSKRLA